MGSTWPSQSHPFPLKGEAIIETSGQEVILIKLSPILHQRLSRYCQANGSREQELVERAIVAWLEHASRPRRPTYLLGYPGE